MMLTIQNVTNVITKHMAKGSWSYIIVTITIKFDRTHQGLIWTLALESNSPFPHIRQILYLYKIVLIWAAGSEVNKGGIIKT